MDPVVVEEFQQTFPCPLVSREGKTCGLTFGSHMSLMGHIRFAHSARHQLDMITVTNLCVFCSSVFRQEHMPGSMLREQFATAAASQAGLLLRAKSVHPHVSFVSCVDFYQPHFQSCNLT